MRMRVGAVQESLAAGRSDRNHEAVKPSGKDFGIVLAEAMVKIQRNSADLEKLMDKCHAGFFRKGQI